MTEQAYPIVVETDDSDEHDAMQVGDNIGTLTIRMNGTTYESDIIVADASSQVDADASYDFGTIRLSGLHVQGSQMSIYRLTGDFGACTVESIALNW